MAFSVEMLLLMMMRNRRSARSRFECSPPASPFSAAAAFLTTHVLVCTDSSALLVATKTAMANVRVLSFYHVAPVVVVFFVENL